LICCSFFWGVMPPNLDVIFSWYAKKLHLLSPLAGRHPHTLTYNVIFYCWISCCRFVWESETRVQSSHKRALCSEMCQQSQGPPSSHIFLLHLFGLPLDVSFLEHFPRICT
jgi:hypothetical protein